MAMAAAQPEGPLRRAALRVLPRRRETLDARLYMLVNRLPHPPSGDEYIELLSDLGKGAGWVTASAWLAIRDGARGRRAGLAATAAMFASVALVQGPLKQVFRRRRPFKRRLAIVVGREPVDSSFPSGHTAGSFAAATALAAFYPAERPLLLLFAGAVGASRVYLGHHFPSDVLVGAVIGSAIGGASARLAALPPRLRQPADLLPAAEAPSPRRHRPRPVRRPLHTVPYGGRSFVESEEA
ncbi:MAG TPA: phosphatase PAP2 family protein [Candidatus Dormibacteraeota bacterium]